MESLLWNEGIIMKAKKLWFEDDQIYIVTDSGQTLWQSLLWYPRLLAADADQRSDYRQTPFGVHWPQIDEDVSFESFTFEPREPDNAVSRVMKSLPEIKVSQLARRIGIPQSVLAAYICGVKNPSAARCKAIEAELHRLGRELCAVQL